MNNKKYDETISLSKQQSLMKAIEIFENEQKNNERIIVRPKINSKKEIITIILKIVVFVFLLTATVSISLAIDSLFVFIVGAIAAIVFLIITIKSTIVSSILLYQKYAPESLRRSCLFEPSCSDYMLIAIDKYGVLKGVGKGIKRLFRCHQPNGGIDYP